MAAQCCTIQIFAAECGIPLFNAFFYLVPFLYEIWRIIGPIFVVDRGCPSLTRSLRWTPKFRMTKFTPQRTGNITLTYGVSAVRYLERFRRDWLTGVPDRQTDRQTDGQNLPQQMPRFTTLRGQKSVRRFGRNNNLGLYYNKCPLGLHDTIYELKGKPAKTPTFEI